MNVIGDNKQRSLSTINTTFLGPCIWLSRATTAVDRNNIWNSYGRFHGNLLVHVSSAAYVPHFNNSFPNLNFWLSPWVHYFRTSTNKMHKIHLISSCHYMILVNCGGLMGNTIVFLLFYICVFKICLMILNRKYYGTGFLPVEVFFFLFLCWCFLFSYSLCVVVVNILLFVDKFKFFCCLFFSFTRL
jgi:hypothetical protein